MRNSKQDLNGLSHLKRVREYMNYKKIKQVIYSMKIWKKTIMKRIRSETSISENQFIIS